MGGAAGIASWFAKGGGAIEGNLTPSLRSFSFASCQDDCRMTTVVALEPCCGFLGGASLDMLLSLHASADPCHHIHAKNTKIKKLGHAS